MVHEWSLYSHAEAKKEKTREWTRADVGAPGGNESNKDKLGLSIGDEIVFKSAGVTTGRITSRDAKRMISADAHSLMTETLAVANNAEPAASGDGSYWYSQSGPVVDATENGNMAGDEVCCAAQAATTSTAQPATLARSLTIPETVEEDSFLVTNGNGSMEAEKADAGSAAHPRVLDEMESPPVKSRIVFPASRKPKLKRLAMPREENLALGFSWISSSAANSPRGDSMSDDDFLSMASRVFPSSPPAGVVRRGSSGLAATILARSNAGKPLRTSSSATHLPLVHSNSTAATRCSLPCCTNHQNHYAQAFSREMSDPDSAGSADSIQDLACISHGGSTSTNRRSQDQSRSCYPFRRPLANATSTRAVCSSPTSSLCSIASTLIAQQASGRNQALAVYRSCSTNLFDDEPLTRIGTPNGGSPSAYDADSHLLAKHLHTEKVVSKHTLKHSLSKYQRLLDRAFALIGTGVEDSIVEGCEMTAKLMANAWLTPKIGHDLAYGLCDYSRQMQYFEILLNCFLHVDTNRAVRLAIGRALEDCLSAPNRSYVVASGDGATLDQFVAVVKSFAHSDDEVNVAISLLESLFEHSPRTNARLIELSALEFILTACKAKIDRATLKRAALALSNLAIYSDGECRQLMIAKNVPDWLFFLASSSDEVTRYYACLSACVLVANKEIETSVIKSGTLDLVEQFLLSHKPSDFVSSDYKNIQGKSRDWLEKLIPVLGAKRRESRSMAAFHFAMEAGIKKDQEQFEMFREMGAVEALKQVAALPEDVAPKFASMALEIIGAEVPQMLTRQAPLWTVEDVQYWVNHIGFEAYAHVFADQKVDGDLLLLLREADLESDIGMNSGLMRRRFMRELEALKMAADYSCVDDTQLDRFLVSVDPRFSIYTYQLLEVGVDRSMLPSITDDILKLSCAIDNPIHRLKLLKAVEECKHTDDMDVALLSKHIDIFISYRRSTGNQLASLIKVLLQLRGYKVFIDVDRLYAGKFDCSLLKNIQAAKHFILVLTPRALDRCVNDDACNDWLHKELLCALQCNKNIIPVFDPQFDWPDESRLPGDVRAVTRFNGVRWVHEYQEACVDKLEKFIEGELNIDRGFYPLPARANCGQYANFHLGSSANSIASLVDATERVLEALNIASHRPAGSDEQLVNANGNTPSPVPSS